MLIINVYTEIGSRAVAVCGTIFGIIFGAVFDGTFVTVYRWIFIGVFGGIFVEIFRLSLVHMNMVEVYLKDTVKVINDMMEIHIPIIHIKDVPVIHRTDHRKDIVQVMGDMLVEHQQKNIVKVMDDVKVVDMKDVVVVRTKDLVQFIKDMMVVHNKVHMKDIVMVRKDVLVLHMKVVVVVMKDMMEDSVKEYMMEFDVWIMHIIMKGGHMKRFLLLLYRHLISSSKNYHFTKYSFAFFYATTVFITQ